jgi:hypothetical protein
MDQAAASARFQAEIVRFHRWRDELTHSVHAYHDWLESSGQLDVQQSIRFYDLLENLNRGRLMLAFLAEFSRGKSELINALFFSSFKERLLPSDVGRTTMCPTEIFHDPSEEPYLKLLSVETRYRDESISQLKNMPIEWSKVRLNINSATDMKNTLKALADTKKVYALEARMLGLAPMNEKGEMPGEEELVDVPAWRYAMINYPHPLLSNGLSILDTPGLNALGMEPELTVSTIPNAHAVLFLLSIDTGVTKSDMEIWERYVKPGLPQKMAVLNKIDLTWDELKSEQEIERAVTRMVETTSAHLNLPRERIFCLSAQKALLAKIRGDKALEEKSGIGRLERFLADEIVPMKRQILCKAVVSEIGGMMVSSRASIAKKQEANKAEIAQLSELSGKSRDVVMKLWQKITAEKNAYNAALAEYKVNSVQFNAKKQGLVDQLNVARLDQLLAASAKAIEDSWTTVGLQRGMKELVRLMSEDFEKVFVASEDIKKLMQGVYDNFIEKFGFQKMRLPSLDLDPHRTKLQLLAHQTEKFADDPVNVLAKEKHFVVKNFYRTLVNSARSTFNDAKIQSDRWLQGVVLPLEIQMKDHKAQLQSRLDSLAKINEKTTSINEQMAMLRAAEQDLKRQRDMIDGLIIKVKEHGSHPVLAESAPAHLAAQDEVPVDFMKTTRVPAFDKTLAKPIPAYERTTKQPAFDPTLAQPMPAPPKAQPAPKAEPAAEKPMVSDDAFAFLNQSHEEEKPDKTVRVTEEKPDKTVRVTSDGERTQQIKPLDPNYRPEPQDIPAEANPGTVAGSETTQRLNLSIQRLQEAKRLLQKQ